MLSLDEQRMADEMARAGFEVVVRMTTGADGSTRYNLSGRGPYGAIIVSAPTSAAAYRAAVDQVRSYMVPVRLAWRGGY